ncbi:PhnD/SsuA/transferrin family substrate-binding protein [Actinomadura sp. NTSP31]|uniref:PhnD/SsuA/transferrin family substrate-binding protein n=1 Tax=Actinomadura sp. NTSP31 TaxID=1735447 RepID=UPI0035C102C3
MTLVMGAVAYDSKVVTIWAGFRAWFARQGFDFDFVLYSNYERQVDDLVAGRIDAAWNSPLAWVRARRLPGASPGRAPSRSSCGTPTRT